MDLGAVFRYHQPTPDKIPRYEAIRAGALEFARIIEDNAPACVDRTNAIRKLREAVFTANAAIALEGEV
jgi:hypothetical protein